MMKLPSYLAPHIKINSNTLDLIIRSKTLELKTGGKGHDIQFDSDFLDMTSET